MKFHLEEEKEYFTKCGLVLDDEFVMKDPSNVTCKNCLKMLQADRKLHPKMKEAKIPKENLTIDELLENEHKLEMSLPAGIITKNNKDDTIIAQVIEKNGRVWRFTYDGKSLVRDVMHISGDIESSDFTMTKELLKTIGTVFQLMSEK